MSDSENLKEFAHSDSVRTIPLDFAKKAANEGHHQSVILEEMIRGQVCVNVWLSLRWIKLLFETYPSAMGEGMSIHIENTVDSPPTAVCSFYIGDTGVTPYMDFGNDGPLRRGNEPLKKQFCAVDGAKTLKEALWAIEANIQDINIMPMSDIVSAALARDFKSVSDTTRDPKDLFEYETTDNMCRIFRLLNTRYERDILKKAKDSFKDVGDGKKEHEEKGSVVENSASRQSVAPHQKAKGPRCL